MKLQGLAHCALHVLGFRGVRHSLEAVPSMLPATAGAHYRLPEGLGTD